MKVEPNDVTVFTILLVEPCHSRGGICFWMSPTSWIYRTIKRCEELMLFHARLGRMQYGSLNTVKVIPHTVILAGSKMCLVKTELLGKSHRAFHPHHKIKPIFLKVVVLKRPCKVHTLPQIREQKSFSCWQKIRCSDPLQGRLICQVNKADLRIYWSVF